MRTQISKIALAATFGLALAFTLSCSSDDNGGGGGNSNGSSTQSGTFISYGGEAYKTVVIGNRTWMAKNLNYAVEGSVCYNDDPANCAKYGRLYDWLMAMDLPAECELSVAGSNPDCTVKTPHHRGICPVGWHIPSNADWDKLYRYVDVITGTAASPYESKAAGRYLKAASGWNGSKGNGVDAYGFAALPGGNGECCNFYLNNDTFSYKYADAGEEGYWWSTSEYNSTVYFRNMSSVNDSAYVYRGDKHRVLSVRCLQDDNDLVFILPPNPNNCKASYSTTKLFATEVTLRALNEEIIQSLNPDCQGEDCDIIAVGPAYYSPAGFMSPAEIIIEDFRNCPDGSARMLRVQFPADLEEEPCIDFATNNISVTYTKKYCPNEQ